MTAYTLAGAKFNDERTKRFILWRRFGSGNRFAMCIGLNPSTANQTSNDRTISFLIKLLDHHHYDGLLMCNLFTNITSKPKELPKDKSEQDLKFLKDTSINSAAIIFCWGTFKEAQGRAKEVITLFPNALCFGHNKDLSPIHPAYFIRNGLQAKDVIIQNYHYH